MNKEAIIDYIYICLKNLASELESEELENPNLQTRIYGAGGIIDSIALVSFIVDLESMLSEKLNTEIVLANSRAMSQHNSPFKDVSSLSDYIFSLIHDS
ncbi:hypothetical protein LS73_006905 [Helicobacter muridarum]|uniref:Carrier domain-containing protein n=1 Tax=Helicobacter muridarum TaxID=216 RepID=A0A099U049_9HELI|nr:hypothetical protein [Helicobacter muridarum]TLD99794.1 hypothetical protein LS73_006905 [Helicobacter muridarum]STQ86971.1 Uncharacterised protein [Helicobacter muridarum]